MKLNQLIAVLKTVKNGASKKQTAVYQLAQKTQLVKGISRTYQPRDEDGYVYPSENQPVQLKARNLIDQFIEASSEYWNLAATQDWANTEAKADIVVDGETVVADVPVTYLLFLEKQLTDVKTFISSLPALDSDQEWRFDENRGLFATEPKQTAKTKKITKPVVLYEATKEHPAQVKEVSEDVVEGTWTLIQLSGGLPQSNIEELLKRVDKLIKAVLQARELANEITVTQKNVADSIFSFIFK